MKRILITALSSLLTLATFIPNAGARTIGGITGRVGGSHAEGACFMPDFRGGVSQVNCSGGNGWTMPTVVDSAGWYAPQYRVQTSSNRISCQNIAYDANGTVVGATPLTNNPVNGISTINPGAVSVPVGGFLEGWCLMEKDTRLINVTW